MIVLNDGDRVRYDLAGEIAIYVKIGGIWHQQTRLRDETIRKDIEYGVAKKL